MPWVCVVDDCGTCWCVGIDCQANCILFIVVGRNEVSQEGISKEIKAGAVILIADCNCTSMTIEVTIAKSVSLGHNSIFVVAKLNRQGLQGTPVCVTGVGVCEAVVVEYAVAIEVRRCSHHHRCKVSVVTL